MVFSFDQSWEDASTASVSGHQNFELNFLSFVFLLYANLSKVWGPHIRSNSLNRNSVVSQWSWSITLLIVSAFWFMSLGIHSISTVRRLGFPQNLAYPFWPTHFGPPYWPTYLILVYRYDALTWAGHCFIVSKIEIVKSMILSTLIYKLLLFSRAVYQD